MDLSPRPESALDVRLRERGRELEAADLHRTLRVIDAADAPPLLNFAGNDYLGLSRHPQLVAAAQAATAEWGTGAGASRLVTGTRRATLALEAELADWKGQPAALVFGSGYAAALGTIPALVGRGDFVIVDRLAHASLIDGARLSGATLRVFPHNDCDRLEAILRRLESRPGHKLILTESLFSMDGDEAPLAALVSLKERYGAWLLVDEAHATGLYGANGAGLVSQAGIGSRIELVLGTLSKALGGVGGYVAASRPVIDWLINRARSFIYSTALPPAAIASSRAAIALLQSAEGADLRAALQARIHFWRKRIPPPWAAAATMSAIQPLICGEARRALDWAQALRTRGFLVPAIRYPTVPHGGARLRVTLGAGQGIAEIDRLIRTLGEL